MELRPHTAALNCVGVASQYLELGLLPFAPEADVEHVRSDAKIEHREVGKPTWQLRVDIQLAVRRMRHAAQYRLHEHEDRTGSPGLGHVGAEILHRELRLVALGAGVELRELIE